MTTRRKNKKAELMDAAAKLVAAGGPEAATVRAIAREAGVTDAAVYRHYRSKDDLCRRAYARILDELVVSKENLLARPGHFRERAYEWIRLTYDYFDRHAEAFAYVFLTSHVVPLNERAEAGKQGKLFMSMVSDAMVRGEIRHVMPEMAYSHFTGVLLNVPRLIRGGVLDGSAVAYVDEVVDTVWRMFRPDA